MDDLYKQLQNPQVLFEGELKSYSEAGGLLVRQMIEDEVPNSPRFTQGMDPYKWLAPYLDKSERTLRAWTYDWESPSGKKPTIHDFFLLITVIGSSAVIPFFKVLGSQINPEQQLEEHNDLVRTVADHIQKLADDLYKLSEIKKS